ncbi:hypothetical protein [Streptomyces sp. NBC_01235]|uniref:hypothetical protein n=1 Tax=Streptomyces sp. NBC_01235 TaxID=2903788 RepID=UPI002E129B9B|nr:hypothetical protein OG289_48275 [Streptomyces sp. NBC_01235]
MTMDLVRRPSHFSATASVRVASPDDVLSWLCLCECFAGGFSSPLMRAGRLNGTLFRVHLALLPSMPGDGVLALTFTSSARSEPTSLVRVQRALDRILEAGEVTPAQWQSAALRLRTRLDTSDRLPRRSLWHRSPYDARLVDPLSWAARTCPGHEIYEHPLAALVHELSGHHADVQGRR